MSIVKLKTIGLRRFSPLLCAFALTLTACLDSAQSPVNVKLIAVNDFHGYLLPPPGFDLSVTDPDCDPAQAAKGCSVSVNVGGAAYLASLVKELKASNPNSLLVSVGDAIGASPAISAWTTDEATIEVLSQMGVELSPVGNHEFDRGKAELLRMQNGGCATLDPIREADLSTCIKGSFSGASFKYLAANAINQDTGKTLFPPTSMRRFGDAQVGFIGLTLKGAAATTRGAGGVDFLDEVVVAREYAKILRSQGADAVVVLLHQGGRTTATKLNDTSCPGLTGDVKAIVEQLAGVADVVLSAHTHMEYVCRINDVLLTQAGFYGNMVADIDLTIVPGRGVIAKTARTVPVINDTTNSAPRGFTIQKPDPEIAQLVNFYDNFSAARRQAEIGFIATDLLRINEPAGARINVADHPVGRVFADAMLAVRGPNGEAADIAFINPGGLRASLLAGASGKITYDDLFALAPFANELFMVDLTGADLIRLLEQQWSAANCGSKSYKGMCGRILQPSATLNYRWTFTPPAAGLSAGQGTLVRDSIRVRGEPLVLDRTYRIATVSFLVVDGGDNYTVFTESGKNLTNLARTDMQALIDYFRANSSIGAPLTVPAARIACDGCLSMP